MTQKDALFVPDYWPISMADDDKRVVNFWYCYFLFVGLKGKFYKYRFLFALVCHILKQNHHQRRFRFMFYNLIS